MPGIVKHLIAMPDVHAGYSFDMSNPLSAVSPGGVGFDINCGMRLIRTIKESLFDHIMVCSKGIIPTKPKGLVSALEMGMVWSIREGYAWPEDKEHCKEYGRMLGADATKVSKLVKKRGLPQMGTLGAGNHYIEIQRVDEI